MEAHDATYQVNGKTFKGYLADGASATKAPGILVCHQGGGLTDHARERVRMLAELGYVAFALDMYGKVATTMQEAMSWLNALIADPAELRKRAEAGLNVLRDQPNADKQRLAAI